MYLTRHCLLFLFTLLSFQAACFGLNVDNLASDTLKLDLTNKPFTVSAHRGDWHRYSENSLESIRSCVAAGINFIEIDIQLSKDGVPVLMHDVTLDRTTTGKGPVSDFTLSELKQLRLKSNQLGVLPYAIPTLEEVLLAFRDHEVFFNLDKVGTDKEKLNVVLDVLENANSLHKAVFWIKHDGEVTRDLYGKYMDKVNLVPFVTDGDMANKDLISLLESSVTDVSPPFIYLCVSKLDESAKNVIAFAKERGIALGCAPTWSHMSFGFSDRISIENEGDGWKELYKLGFVFFETNYPFELKAVLEDYLR